jgi:hypothetical protein
VGGPRSSGIRVVIIAFAVLAGSSALASVASAASIPLSSGGIGVRLVADTPSSSAEPLGLVYVVERIAPGRRVIRQIEISNTTDATADVAVFPAAASIVGGKFSFAPGRTANPLSSWTTVARSVLRLAPGATAIDALTIKVPNRSSAGERYAVVWAEVSTPSSTRSGVRLVNRVGVRMYISVGKGGIPVAEFSVGSLAAGRSANGDPTVTATVDNTGQSALDITGELSLSDGPGGLSAGPFAVALGTMLAPSHSAIERVWLDSQFPRGPWRADLAVSSDGVQQSSVARIRFPAKAVMNAKRSLASALSLAALIALVLILVALGVVLSGFSFVRSSRRHRQWLV